jgi:autotransporter-associated beta strand protein
MLVAAPAALAQDATWLTTPASGDFNTAANWTPGGVPFGFATFGNSSVTTLTFSGNRNIGGGFIFDSGAPAYTFDLVSGFGLQFQTDGIINNSANAPTFNVRNSPLIFNDSSTAGNAIINLNAGTVQFLGSSTAGTAQLNTATGTTFDFTGTAGPAVNGIFSAGSISGDGNFDLGVGHRLLVGSNDLSTTVSGTIVSGAITKVGAGTLTLSGSNTYAGGTTLSSGALMIGNSSALGSGDLSMALGTTLGFDSAAAYTIANNISIAGDPIFDVAAGPAQTVSGVISDTDPLSNPGIVEKNGAGTLILSGANTYSGGTIINAGTLQVTNSTPGTSSSVGIGAVTLNGGTFQADGSSDLTFSNNFKINTAGGAVDNNGTVLTLSGLISNGNGTTGVLQITDSSVGFGTTLLSGANTYSGGTKVIGATLQVNNNNSVGTGLVTLENGLFQVADTILTPTLSFSNNFAINNTPSGSAIDVNGYSLTISGNITDGNGPGKLTVSDSFGGGVLILTGTNTYSGGTDICNCGTLQLGTTVTPGSILGAVTNNGTFDIVNANTSGITTVTNKIFATTIFRNSTDAGTMTIDNQSGGSVEFRQISSAANATINNDIFARTTFFNSSTAGNATINNIAGFGTGLVELTNLSTAGAATINNDSGEVHFIDRSNAGTATINNTGFGILDFANRTTADNATIVNSSAIGMAFLDQSTAGNAFITTNNNSVTLFFNRSDGGTARFETEAGSAVDFSGSRGPLADRKIHAGSIAGAGDYFIGNRNTLIVGGNNLSTEVSGVVADSCGCGPGGPGGVLEKVGTGTLTLSGTNTYSGGTTITAGILQLGNGTATGSILGDVVNNATLVFNRSNAYQFDRAISGSGAVQQNGFGTTTLTAVNTYAGATTIGAGALALSGAGSIANSSGVIDNGAFDISATAAGASIKNLSGAGIVTLGSQTLTLTNAAGTFGGEIGGSGGLIKQGAGLFELSGTNTYLGATTVAGGELRVNGSVASAVNVQSGATLSGIGNVGGLVTIQSGGTLSAGQSPGTLTLGALNLNAGSTSFFELGSAGVVGGANNDLVNVTGNLTLGGALSVNAPSAGYYRLFNYGTLTASSFGAINGSSNGTPTVLTNVPNQVNLLIAGAGQRVQFWDGADQTGNGVVNGGSGTWNAANTNWTGAPGQAGINDQWRSSVGMFAGTAGTVTIAGAQAFDTLQFSTTGYVLNAGAGGQLQLAGLSGTGTVNTDNGVAATIDAPIVNGSSTSLTKVGGGTLILTGVNTYNGGTVISGGTLQLGNGGTTGSIVGNVTDNGIFAINRSDAFTFSGTISGSGAFQQLGAGTTILTADNNYSGGTTISAGTLQLGNGDTTGSIVGNVHNNSVLTINRSNALVLGGVISGTGTLNQIGSGTTTLGGANTYTGVTTISNGTLVIAAGGSITSNVTNNATFNNSGLAAGSVANNATFNNNANGIVSGLLTNTAATTTNFGQLNGGANVTGGVLTNNNLISGAVGISGGGTLNNNQTIAGAVTNAAVFNNNVNGTVSGLVTNNGGTTTNAGQLNGGANVSGGTLTNNNLISGAVVNSGGILNNNLTISGAVTNASIFNNNAGGSVSGLLTNTGGNTINAGRLNGGASVAGGALTTTGTILNGLTNSAFVNANGGAVNGAIANNAGGTFNVLGTVTGDSIFTNAANAVLAIGASGAYTLQGMLTNSGAVTVASGGQLIATVGGITNNAGGTIAVALGGTVKDDLNNAGAVINNGVYVANVASNTGAIDNNKTWTGTVSNAAVFNNNAGATVSGLLTNTAGPTVNNGALNGGANVNGGTFTGSGSVTNLTVSGGVFAPGNGTPGSSMTITGNLAFQSGALYLVQLNPATSTFANVTGTAALNGGAGAAFLAGNYVAKQYTILTAAGGVSGAFGSFDTLNMPSGFRASLSYDANNVFLNLDLALAKYSGLNVNQQNVANALTNFFNATGGIPAVFGTLTPGGLTQASGELATASQQTTFDAMNLFLGLLTDPFVAGRGAPVAPSTLAPQFADEGDANAYAATRKPRTKDERDAYAAIARKAPMQGAVYDPRWSVWAAGFGGSQTTDGNTVLGSNTATSRVFGTAVGADYLFSPRTLAGFALAGGGTNFSVNGLGAGRSDLFQAGAFVRHTNGPAYISAALAYGWQDVTTDRTAAVIGGGALRATFNANAFSGRVEGGYRFVTPWMAMGLTPYAAGQFTTFDLPAYAEQAITGGNMFALNYASKNVTASRSEFGLRSDKSFAMQDGIFTLRGRAAWAHNFNPDRNIAATFQTLPGASFVVNGAAQASDSALVTGSAEMKWLNGFSLAATFEGEFSDVTRSYAGKGVVRYAW